MKLSEVELKKPCVIKSVDIQNEKIKIRLMELGLVNGCRIRIEKKSIFKQTLLIVFCATCFTLKTNLAK
ncbi:MAG: ferrous iron transport protein A, partial [Clostridia bacterium]|nr:ferrous iron transport protein A [Clostridia bacterium]